MSDLQDFIKRLEALSPGERDGIIGDGAGLMSEFGFDAEALTTGIADEVPCLHAALQSYFFLYLWELRIIDDQFIKEVSSASSSDPQAYERVKDKFLEIIKDIPIEMIDVVTQIYNQKNKGLSKQNKENSLDHTIEKEVFFDGLRAVVENVKVMVNSDLHPKIEAIFDNEKQNLLTQLSNILNLPSEDKVLNTLVSRINDVYRDWAENKEQHYDEQGRSLMSFLTSGTVPAPSEENEEDEFKLPVTKSFLPTYNHQKKTLLPLKVLSQLQAIIREVNASTPEGGINPEQHAKLMVSQEILDHSLQEYIKILEHANRFVFGAMQLVDAKKLTASNKKGTQS